MQPTQVRQVRGIVQQVVGAAAIVLSAQASAAIVPAASARGLQVAVDIGDGTLTDGTLSALPGLFDEQREVQALQPNPQQRLARGTARQTSDFGATSISASGQVQADVSLAAPALAPAQGEAAARSSFVLEFALDTTSSYQLSGFVDTFAIATGGAALPALTNTVRFESLDSLITLFETLTDDEGFALSGTLGPGNYRLTAFADAQSLLQSGSAFVSVTGNSAFHFSFTATSTAVPVPEPSVPALLAAAGLAAAFIGRCRRPPASA